MHCRLWRLPSELPQTVPSASITRSVLPLHVRFLEAITRNIIYNICPTQQSSMSVFYIHCFESHRISTTSIIGLVYVRPISCISVMHLDISIVVELTDGLFTTAFYSRQYSQKRTITSLFAVAETANGCSWSGRWRCIGCASLNVVGGLGLGWGRNFTGRIICRRKSFDN